VDILVSIYGEAFRSPSTDVEGGNEHPAKRLAVQNVLAKDHSSVIWQDISIIDI